MAFQDVYQPNGKDKASMHPSSQTVKDAVGLLQLFSMGRMIAAGVMTLIAASSLFGVLTWNSRISVLEENDKSTATAIIDLKGSITSLEKTVDQKFDAMNTRIEAGFQRMEARFERVDARTIDLVASGKIQNPPPSAASTLPSQASIPLPDPIRRPAKKGAKLTRKPQPTLWQTITGH